jgi:hypothetical protein
MQLVKKFQERLQTSADEFLWAVSLVPQERLFLAPREDKWPVARLLFHLGLYEKTIALPTMRQWFGGAKPIVGTQEEDEARENQAWNEGQGHEITSLSEEFKAGRAEQIALLAKLTDERLQERLSVLWGERSLQWVLTKTYQHTLEHTDEVLRSYLWWK